MHIYLFVCLLFTCKQCFASPFKIKRVRQVPRIALNLGTAMASAIIVFIRHFFFRKKTAHLIADALEFMYTPWPDKSNEYALRSQLVDLLGDYLFFAPSHEVADAVSYTHLTLPTNREV